LEFTPACQAGGRGFESRRDRQTADTSSVRRCGNAPVNTVE
jgi:hypothetical protein